MPLERCTSHTNTIEHVHTYLLIVRSVVARVDIARLECKCRKTSFEASGQAHVNGVSAIRSVHAVLENVDNQIQPLTMGQHILWRHFRAGGHIVERPAI